MTDYFKLSLKVYSLLWLNGTASCHLQTATGATAKLGQMLVNHKAATAQHEALAAARDPDGNVSMLPPQAAQRKQDPAACRDDIVGLIDATFSCFAINELDSVKALGCGSFADIALAFDLPYVFEGILGKSLQVIQTLCHCMHGHLQFA